MTGVYPATDGTVSGAAAANSRGRAGGWTRASLALWASSLLVLAVALPMTSSARAFVLGLSLVLAPLAAGAGCLSARATASPGARSTWGILALGAGVSTVGQILSVHAWFSLRDVVAFPSPSFLLFVTFHVCVAEGAILALRPARDPRLALEIALDGVLVLLATALVLLRFVLDAPVAQGWLSPNDAAGILIGQMAVAGSLLFTALLVLWRDTEVSGAVADMLFVAVVLFTFGNVLITMGIDPLPGRTGDLFDAIRLGGWVALGMAGFVATRRPEPTTATDRRGKVARRTRLLVIPAAALFLAMWAVDVAVRNGATDLSYMTIIALGVTLAVRIGVALYAVEREADERRAAERYAALARLRAVTAQMNPHFLFNALHSLSALIRRDVRASEDVIERLGKLLRYGLDRGDSLVTLAEEWGFAENYIRLEHVRLGDRLSVEADVDTEALDELVPPFVIQPLVENAIRHGIDKSATGGLLRIRARSREGMLNITIWDSGNGAPPGAIHEATGVGLRGVKAQLATHFGSRAVLTTDQPPGGGFTVSLAIPVDGGEGEE